MVSEDDMLRKSINESSEPVVGRLAACGERVGLVNNSSGL